MVGILLFLFAIMANISAAMKTMMSSLGESQAAISGGSSAMPSGLNVNFFMNFPVDKMGIYVATVILLITLSNTIAGRIVYGGDRYIFYLFASILFVISGALSIVAPAIVTTLLPISMPAAIPGV
jgi:flagellar protein FlaJ